MLSHKFVQSVVGEVLNETPDSPRSHLAWGVLDQCPREFDAPIRRELPRLKFPNAVDDLLIIKERDSHPSSSSASLEAERESNLAIIASAVITSTLMMACAGITTK